MNTDQNTSKSVLPWHLSWLTVVLIVLAVGTLIAVSDSGVRYMPYATTGVSQGTPPMPSMYGAESKGGSGAPAVDMAVSNTRSYPYPYPTPEVPITDTREFLKTSYNASLYTRDVPNLTRRVETTVRGHGGRVNQESSAPQYGYVSFSLPQSKYEAFRTEVESFVGSRFISVNVSSENLLSQKVSIEEQQKQANTTLADYKASRQRIVTAHANTVQAIQAKINATQDESERATHEAQLAQENASYQNQLRTVDANIKYAQDWQKAVQTQDTDLLDNVATVTGTISLQWISLWEVILLYLPGYWIPAIFAALAAFSYLRDRRRNVKAQLPR